MIILGTEQIDNILEKIEMLRAELEHLLDQKDVKSEVLEKSRELDEYINKYYKYLKKLNK